MISFFTEDECNDIINLSDNLEFKNNNEFGKFSYSFINENWIVNKIIEIFENNKKIKISETPIVRIIKLNIGDTIPINTFNYTSGQYKNTSYGSYIFLNNNISGGEFYINGNVIQKEIGKGTIQSIDTKTRISKILKNKLYLIVVNFYKMQVNSII
jgi:hypothetical protein